MERMVSQNLLKEVAMDFKVGDLSSRMLAQLLQYSALNGGACTQMDMAPYLPTSAC